MKKCIGAEHHSSSSGGVILRRAASQSSQCEDYDDDGGAAGSFGNTEFQSCMLPYDEEIAEMKKSVERILGEVKSEYHEPLTLEINLQRCQEPLLRLRTFLDNNRDPPSSSSPAVNGPCKDPIQALRAFLDR